MTRPFIPQIVLDAAHARSAARVARAWDEADRLRSEIEAAGWRVVDRGTDFRLELASLPDTLDGDVIRYGGSAAVPSRMGEPSSMRATIVIDAPGAPEAVQRTLMGVEAHRTPDDQIVVVVDGPDQAIESCLAPFLPVVEVIRTADRLGAGAALNIGLRRAVGAAVILLDGTVEPIGDLVAPLVSALTDPGVVVVGARGRTTVDLRTFEEVDGGGDVTSIASGVLAFRRADGIAAGPVDESFIVDRYLDLWWSLVLRGGREDGEPGSPGRAVVVPGLPAVVHAPVPPTRPADPVEARQAKRNFYRVLGRFRNRPDLLIGRGLA